MNILVISGFCLTLFCLACRENTPKTAEKNTGSIADPQYSTRIEILDEDAYHVVDTSAKIEFLGGGFKWTEGPLFIKDGSYLLFSDIPANKVHKWKDGEGMRVYLDSAGSSADMPGLKEPGSNGLTLDKNNRLILCQHGTRRVARMNAPLDAPVPEYIVLADRYKGKRLNSPNDAVCRANGDIYFTDPPYGVDSAAIELGFHGVYRLKPDGQLDLLTKEHKYPNGIALSPDEKILYVAHSDPENRLWMRYELDDQGTIQQSSAFYKIGNAEKDLPGLPDGLKVNKEGYVFASGPGGIWIFQPSGKLIARIYTGDLTSNCAFDRDQQMLYMTCNRQVARLKLK